MKLRQGVLFGAAAAGAALAFYLHGRENKKPDGAGISGPAEPPGHHGRPVSLLLDGKKNMEQVTREALRAWFVENTDAQVSGNVMVVAAAYDSALASMGYELDVALDQDHCLLLQIRDRDSQDCLKECLVSFIEMETELKELLDHGNGVIKVNG